MKRISIRMPDELHDSVVLLAEATGKSVNQLVVETLEAQVEEATSSDEHRKQIAARLREQAERYGIDLSGEG